MELNLFIMYKPIPDFISLTCLVPLNKAFTNPNTDPKPSKVENMRPSPDLLRDKYENE